MIFITAEQHTAAEDAIVAFLAKPFGQANLGDLPLMLRVKLDENARRAFAKNAVFAVTMAKSTQYLEVVREVAAAIADGRLFPGPVGELIRHKSADIQAARRARGQDEGPTAIWMAAKNIVLRVFQAAGRPTE